MGSTDGSLSRARAVASEVFGHATLLPGQDQAIGAVLSGHDVLLVSPTGSGKSLTYQVAGTLLDGCTVVVSPLLALQHDQIRSLEETGAPRGARISSEETDAQQDAALRDAESGAVEFLFVAPEQLANAGTRDRLARLRPSLVAVDEAHCVSSWGHDFRPDYRRLGELIRELGSPRVLAMTATAAPPVRTDIVERLGLRDHVEVVTGFARDNIDLAVRHCADPERQRDAVLEVVDDGPGPGILYCRTRRSTEEYAAALAAQGIRTAVYHAGLGKRRRTAAHEAFLSGGVDVMVATSAFGMGIDKPDIRYVVHTQVPDSPDTYYQEVGRAGRDGEPARAVLAYRPEDLSLGRFFAGGIPHRDDVVAVLEAVDSETVDRARLRERTGIGPRRLQRILNLRQEVRDAGTEPVDAEAVLGRAESHRALERSRVEMMRGYAETGRCRTDFLLAYFGETVPGPCGHCDNCRSGSAQAAATQHRETAGGLAPDSRVRHPAFGTGVVTDVEPDRVTVLFDEVGYRTLAVEVVESEDLLEPVD